MKGNTRELHTYIDIFETRISAQMHEVLAPDLSVLYVEISILCSEVQ